MNDTAIKVEHVSKVYRAGRKISVNALRDVSLEIKKGEIFALLGPNGAGKTTLMKILLGLVFPTAGSAAILEYSVLDCRSRRNVGYLPEQPSLPSAMVLPAFLKFSGKLSGVAEPALSRRADELISRFRLSETRSLPLSKFSKGMLRLAGITQALINDPQILMLDEPSDGLDPAARLVLRETLKSFRDRGKTVFLNSHLLLEVEIIADRAAIMKDGRIIRTGTMAELTATDDTYTVKVRNDLPAGIQQLLSHLKIVSGDGMTTVEAGSIAELNRVIDLLRAAGVSIENTGRRHVSLEESYISITKERDDE